MYFLYLSAKKMLEYYFHLISSSNFHVGVILRNAKSGVTSRNATFIPIFMEINHSN
jgi:hypothetical protein